MKERTDPAYKAYTQAIAAAVRRYETTVANMFLYPELTDGYSLERLVAIEATAWQLRLEACDRARELLAKLPFREEPEVGSSSKGEIHVKDHPLCSGCSTRYECKRIGCQYR